MTQGNFKESITAMINDLSKCKCTSSEINLANLLVEETFFCLEDGVKNRDSAVKMKIYKRLGETGIILRVKGHSYNPLIISTETEEDEIYTARRAILNANRDRMSYIYKNGENIITIVVHRLSSKKKKLIYTVLAMALGILTGFLMQTFLPHETIVSIDLVTDMVKKIFLQLLNMLVAPLTFFSILSGLSQMSDASDAGRIGSRLAWVTVLMMLVMSFLSMISGIFFFSEDLSFMRQSMTVEQTNSEEKYFSFMNMVIEIFPQNLVDPIKTNNIMQVMFLSIFFGILISRMKPCPTWINEGISALRRLFTSALEIVVIAIPLVVFLSMMSLTALSRPESLMQLVKLIIGQGFGVILALLVSVMMIGLLGGVSPINFAKKAISFSPIPFSASSSNAALPDTIKFAKENLGISSRLTSFLIPVGLQFNKQGNCFFFAMATAMMMKVYGIELNTDNGITFFITLFLMSITKPSIPCAGIICLTYLFTAMGIPSEAVMTVLGIEPIMSLFIAVCNVVSNTAVAFIVAQKEKMIDFGIYNKLNSI